MEAERCFKMAGAVTDKNYLTLIFEVSKHYQGFIADHIAGADDWLLPLDQLNFPCRSKQELRADDEDHLVIMERYIDFTYQEDQA